MEHQDWVVKIRGRGKLERTDNRAQNMDSMLLRCQTERHEATMPNTEAFAQAVADRFMAKDATDTVYLCSQLFCTPGVVQNDTYVRSTQTMPRRSLRDTSRIENFDDLPKFIENESSGPYRNLMSVVPGINTSECYFRVRGDRAQIAANLTHAGTLGSQANKGNFQILDVTFITPSVDLENGLFRKLDNGDYEPIRTVPVALVPKLTATMSVVWDRFKPPYHAGQRVPCIGPRAWIMLRKDIQAALGFTDAE